MASESPPPSPYTRTIPLPLQFFSTIALLNLQWEGVREDDTIVIYMQHAALSALYSWLLTATEIYYVILFLTTPAFSLVIFPVHVPCRPVFSQKLHWCVEFYRSYLLQLGYFSVDRNVNQAYEWTRGTPKGFINFYSFKHNILMGIFSCGEGLLLSTGVFILSRWPQIFVKISELALFGSYFGIFS